MSAACNAVGESADIGKTTPTIVTAASGGGSIGTVLTDQATLSGGVAPTGTITFVLYGPNDATCTTAVFTSNAIAVNGNGTYTSAPGFTPTLPGTYRWRAFYSGDANNAAVSGPCGAAGESADITSLAFTIVKTPSAGAVGPGQPLSYTIIVTNNGPGAANGAIIADPAIPFYTVTNVVCVGTTGGASCPAPLTVAALQGSGMTVAIFPAGATVTLRVDGISTLPNGQLVNSVTVTPPNGTPDVVKAPPVVAVTPLPPTPVEPIPTLSWNALIALMLLVALVAPFYLRRARR